MAFSRRRFKFIIVGIMKIVSALIKLLISILLLLLLAGFVQAFLYDIAVLGEHLHDPQVRWFLFGLSVGTVLWFVWIRKKLFFIAFEHELTHLVVALLFFRSPKSFEAKEGSGQVQYEKASNLIIALAPYFLPTYSLFVLIVYVLASNNFKPYIAFLIGVSLAYHIFSNIKEFSFKQPDIQKSGYAISTALFMFGNVFFTGLLISVLVGKEFAKEYLKLGWSGSVDLVKGIISGFNP